MGGPKRDYYEVLQVERTADADALKKAFRKLAMMYHPDRNPGDKQAEEKFKEASEAYEVLSDAERRARYDRFGHQGLEGFSGQGQYTTVNINDIFGEIFGDIFGGGGRRRGQRNRGQDLRYNLELSFEEAAFGTEVSVTLPRPKRCEECAGTGSRSRQLRTCPTCGGSGEVRYTQGFFAVARTCSQCSGSGSVVADPCKSCKGSGTVDAQVELNLKVPPGVDSGMRQRIAGEGEPGENGGPPGDLHVVFHVREHPILTREGTDVFCEVYTSFVQATLGGHIDVPTLDGMVKMKIPEGTQSGQILRLKGKGVPQPGGSARGDQHVKVIVETPRNLTSRQRELLEKFAEATSDDTFPKTRSFFDKAKELFGSKVR